MSARAVDDSSFFPLLCVFISFWFFFVRHYFYRWNRQERSLFVEGNRRHWRCEMRLYSATANDKINDNLVLFLNRFLYIFLCSFVFLYLFPISSLSFSLCHSSILCWLLTLLSLAKDLDQSCRLGPKLPIWPRKMSTLKMPTHRRRHSAHFKRHRIVRFLRTKDSQKSNRMRRLHQLNLTTRRDTIFSLFAFAVFSFAIADTGLGLSPR